MPDAVWLVPRETNRDTLAARAVSTRPSASGELTTVVAPVARTFTSYGEANDKLCCCERYVAVASSTSPVVTTYLWGKAAAWRTSRLASPATALCLAVDGTYLLAGAASGELHAWVAASGDRLPSLNAHYRRVGAVAYDSTLGLVLTGADDGVVSAWPLASIVDADTPAEAKARAWCSFSEHTMPVSAVVSLRGGRCASASADGTVRVRCLYAQTSLLTLTFGGAVAATALAASADAQRLFAGFADGTLRSIDLSAAALAQTSAAGDAAVVWQGGGGSAAAAAAAGSAPSSDANEMRGHTAAVLCCSASPCGALVATSSADGTCRLFDVATRTCVQVLGRQNAGPPVRATVLARLPGALRPEIAGAPPVAAAAAQAAAKAKLPAHLAKFVSTPGQEGAVAVESLARGGAAAFGAFGALLGATAAESVAKRARRGPSAAEAGAAAAAAAAAAAPAVPATDSDAVAALRAESLRHQVAATQLGARVRELEALLDS